MIKFAEGNLLEAKAEALVNTVNTVGVMGKGVALMFKEAFPENFKLYEDACTAKKVRVGEMFVTEHRDLYGPKWIVNFPTKAHWRYPSKIDWISKGLDDLKRVIVSKDIKSIALPPLGAGNGGLDWREVRELILDKLSSMEDVHVIVYEPTRKYQNVAKRAGVEKLTPARALIAELVRRYSILGIECSLLEIQKLAYFAERFALMHHLPSLKFEFAANKYGPYSDNLKHLLNSLDGSYLHCEKRLGDAGPFEPIHFNDAKKDIVSAYFTTEEAKPYRAVLDSTSQLIDGFESPLGMELLATVDWLVHRENTAPEVEAIKTQLPFWTGGKESAQRKVELFEDRIVGIALEALGENSLTAS
ncbi:O-acetyl-ADP-ribose deacetylase (regulator of RNase III), contains Macro domain [Phyllobacterium sp. YR620]|uniref:type II toxin-antitoxin system antitoxin DNA ADP-ribosyl glycohydrolase DarG n=1 Tax=Phyllobacterium sp. YR620 TaxID=1881066 RepID=UPI00088EC559|nr:macro domain-containing protein [Phyllobacterium sp. YR620]SDP47089.1 O-acetyl-ADP-ribose deacetylase (regulator of RNase III), contains Macro domain [Phyllobacterium sp. YR620]